MEFHSMLFKKDRTLDSEAPGFFADLNIDQVVDAVTYGKEEYNLKPFYYTLPGDIETITYRQEIMKDLEDVDLSNYIKRFAQSMQTMRRYLPKEEDTYYKYERERFFLDAVKIYCDTVHLLSGNLRRANITSSGFLAFREYLDDYVQSHSFKVLSDDTEKLLNSLSSIKYCVLSKDLKVSVLPDKGEMDYSKEVEQTFEKFKRDAVKDYSMEFTPPWQMNHVEANILKGVAQLYPETFKTLDEYCIRYINYTDQIIILFDREVQFYMAYLAYIFEVRRASLKFCYPEVSAQDKNIYSFEGFDLALAYQLVREEMPVVGNDFYLEDKERIIIVSGPNQGGKTTFARAFGQLHYLAAMGCLVPGARAKLFLFDQLFCHFEREENVANLRSKLEDDLIRMHDMLQQATPNSIIIMNEILSSTTLQDAILLSQKIMEKITALDVLCVWVTFIDELLSFSDKTVSMVSTVKPENPTIRTFKIERRPANGLAYALSIAEKYSVTYNALKKRINV
jgi:DNA mismatch repair ATPase MutS